MGAHVWAPAFLRDHLLAQRSDPGLDAWTGTADLPLYRFYMVIPALAIVALDVILPYGVAFKIVAMSGLVTFPAACWAFGRLAAFRHPIPELFAFAGLCFLLDESFEIYGGNVKSTMAGEYSFSIALTLAVLGLGLLANGLRTGQVPRLDRRRAVARRRLARHRPDLRRGRGDDHLPRLDRQDPHRLRRHRRDHDDPAVGLVGRSVPVRSRVHDRHEVRVPAEQFDRLVLGHVLPAHAGARHRDHRARGRRIRRVRDAPSAHRHGARPDLHRRSPCSSGTPARACR